MIDLITIGAAVQVCKNIPGSAAQTATEAKEAAQAAAETAVAAAESVTVATVQEIRTELGY